MNKQQPITTLFLDVGGVIRTNGWDHKLHALAAMTFGLGLKELESRHSLNFDTYEAVSSGFDRFPPNMIE